MRYYQQWKEQEEVPLQLKQLPLHQAHRLPSIPQRSDPDKGLPSTSTKPACVPIHDLIIGGYSELNDDEYSGRVMVKKGTGTYENIYFYEVWIQKGRQMMIVGAGATDDEGKKVDISADGSTPTKIVDITESHVEDYVSSFTAYESCPQGS